MLLLLAFQIISGYVWVCFTSCPGIPTPRCKCGWLHSDFIEFLTCMLKICLYRKGVMEGEKRGVGNVSFRWWRKPECPERTTGQPQVTDNLTLWTTTLVRISLSYGGPKGRWEFAHLLTPGENFSSTETRTHNQTLAGIITKPNELTNCAVSAPLIVF